MPARKHVTDIATALMGEKRVGDGITAYYKNEYRQEQRASQIPEK